MDITTLSACPYCESAEQVVHEHGRVLCYGCYDAETGGETGGYQACGPMGTADSVEEWNELCADRADDARERNRQLAEHNLRVARHFLSSWDVGIKPFGQWTREDLAQDVADAEAECRRLEAA